MRRILPARLGHLQQGTIGMKSYSLPGRKRLGGDWNIKAQGLANTAWTVATANYGDEKLFATLARAAKRRLSEFGSHEFAHTAWVFATEPEMAFICFTSHKVARPGAATAAPLQRGDLGLRCLGIISAMVIESRAR